MSMCRYLASFISYAFYIKYNNLLSFEVLKCSKSLNVPPVPALVTQYCFWKPPSKNPGYATDKKPYYLCSSLISIQEIIAKQRSQGSLQSLVKLVIHFHLAYAAVL